MLEARILQGSVLKKIIESIRELVVDANFDCDPNGISMQVKAPATIYLRPCPRFARRLTRIASPPRAAGDGLVARVAVRRDDAVRGL